MFSRTTSLEWPLKQSSPSCERNKEPILAVLKEVLPRSGLVLEIGSGTGQHAAYFAAHLPQLTWQPSDLPKNFPSIRTWAADAGLSNLREPLELDLLSGHWPVVSAATVVCISTIHIVAWAAVEKLFAGAGKLLTPGGVLYAYGPYRYANRPLEPSNEVLRQMAQDARPGIGRARFRGRGRARAPKRSGARRRSRHAGEQPLDLVAKNLKVKWPRPCAAGACSTVS